MRFRDYIYSETRKGRGAPTNEVSRRFNLQDRAIDGDWLDERDHIDDAPAKLRTEVTIEFPKSIINYNRSPDLPFDRSINAYRGCEHGCVYCFARPTHAYHDLSPGLDFESRLFAKPNAADLLRRTFAKPNYQPASLAIGTNTDPYQPIERNYRITRQILEVIWKRSTRLSSPPNPTGLSTISTCWFGWRSFSSLPWRSRSLRSSHRRPVCWNPGPRHPPDDWKRCRS